VRSRNLALAASSRVAALEADALASRGVRLSREGGSTPPPACAGAAPGVEGAPAETADAAQLAGAPLPRVGSGGVVPQLTTPLPRPRESAARALRIASSLDLTHVPRPLRAAALERAAAAEAACAAAASSQAALLARASSAEEALRSAEQARMAAELSVSEAQRESGALWGRVEAAEAQAQTALATAAAATAKAEAEADALRAQLRSAVVPPAAVEGRAARRYSAANTSLDDSAAAAAAAQASAAAETAAAAAAAAEESERATAEQAAAAAEAAARDIAALSALLAGTILSGVDALLCFSG
jgi:hypothetical protein